MYIKNGQIKDLVINNDDNGKNYTWSVISVEKMEALAGPWPQYYLS